VHFEFDAEKSALNKTKHDIDFVEAQALWQDAGRVEIPARTRGELRFATLGKLGAEVWIAIWTPRGDAVRLISVRRAQKAERQVYGA
jgi:uncharacterized DUF497 family protein